MIPLLLLLLLALIWGSSFILIKKSLQSFSYLQVGALRLTFASIILLPIAIINYRKFRKDKILFFISIGLLGNAIPAFLFPIAQAHGVSSSVAGILNTLMPIFVFTLGLLFFSAKSNLLQISGLLVAFLGSFILMFINQSGALGSFNTYLFWIILAIVCYSLSANITNHFLKGIKPIHIASFSLLFISPFSISLLLSTDFFTIIVQDQKALSSLFFVFLLGVFGTAFALILFNQLVQLSGAVFASSVAYLMPIVSLLWGLIDGEHIYLLHYLGMVFIIIGIYLVRK